MADATKPVYTVSVKELVGFVLRRGDLGEERDFVGSNRALAGTRGHQQIQRSRPSGYEKEVAVEYFIESGEFTLHIRGRIDGLMRETSPVQLEEIKTVAGNAWDREPDPLHWAQAKFYAYFFAMEQGIDFIEIQLTYLELQNGKITEFKELCSLSDLKEFCDGPLEFYRQWMQERHDWQTLRNASISKLNFPFANYRPGQRQLAVTAYRTLTNGGRAFIEAPTGIGKTISTIFPAVKAMGEGALERIFYLTAKTVGRGIAEKAFADLRTAGLRFASLTLTAKGTICVRDGELCDALTCPLARGYYDRRIPAIREALQREEIDRAAIEAVAQKHQVCPFELSLDVSTWADAVICDFNYVFDPKVYLRRHFEEEGGDYAFLIDEAHNLVDRAREMFSAELKVEPIMQVSRSIKATVPKCAKALRKLGAQLRELCEGEGAGAVEETELEEDLFVDQRKRVESDPVKESVNQARLIRAGDQTLSKVYITLPAALGESLEVALKEAEAWLVKNETTSFREELIELYFALHSFRRTAELYDERYLTLTSSEGGMRIKLFCLDPSFLLREALKRGKAALFFSATLTPLVYYRELLGGLPEDAALQLESPFDPQRLEVLIHDRIETTFKARKESLDQVVGAIAAVVGGKVGNYLVYFPSFAYLAATVELFRRLHPSFTVIEQRSGMAEQERESFLKAFHTERGETLVGFAVLGGIFGEGIDMVGERLIGAVIVGVGLPQLNVERDLIAEHFERRGESGFDYAYTFPGMNRVLQAVGRVIRSETDRGVVLLIDRRFAEARYRRLIPTWWHPKRVRYSEQIVGVVSEFWNG